ncbi:hypothetical protein LCGC14_1056170 [marine sediment metagenome]|uniref:Uncharacterized protein n=1 Tax=marine sediment metagenome TaxID=412755 RepID=A0A0F9MRZ6_9ZZZZ
MWVYVTHTQTSIVTCAAHREDAEAQGWSFLEYREPTDSFVVGWDCYFEREYRGVTFNPCNRNTD